MDKFDKIIKEAVESYEAPYDAQVWANVSGQLGNKGGGTMKWIVGSAAAVALITGGVYLAQNQNEPVSDKPLTETVNSSGPVSSNDLNTDNGNSQHTGANGHSTVNADSHVPADNSIPTDNSVSGANSGDHQPTGNNSHSSTGNDNQMHYEGPDRHDIDNNANSVQTIQAQEPVVKANARFDAGSAIACLGSSFLFTPEDINQSALYVWDFGDGSYSSSKIGEHVFAQAGTYTVTLSLKDNRSNKTLTKSSIEVTVNPAPEVAFTWEKSNEMIPTVNFINLTESAESWNWDIKGLKTSSENTFEYTFRKKGSYVVALSATNEYGCDASAEKTIEIKNDYNLLAPTAFTPNGDNKNDYFIPEALRIMDVEFTMVIYDKSGRLMYQTNEVNLPWDGTNVTDNSPAEEGAYVWKVQFKNANGELEMYEGQVIITR